MGLRSLVMALCFATAPTGIARAADALSETVPASPTESAPEEEESSNSREGRFNARYEQGVTYDNNNNMLFKTYGVMGNVDGLIFGIEVRQQWGEERRKETLELGTISVEDEDVGSFSADFSVDGTRSTRRYQIDFPIGIGLLNRRWTHASWDVYAQARVGWDFREERFRDTNGKTLAGDVNIDVIGGGGLRTEAFVYPFSFLGVGIGCHIGTIVDEFNGDELHEGFYAGGFLTVKGYVVK